MDEPTTRDKKRAHHDEADPQGDAAARTAAKWDAAAAATPPPLGTFPLPVSPTLTTPGFAGGTCRGDGPGAIIGAVFTVNHTGDIVIGRIMLLVSPIARVSKLHVRATRSGRASPLPPLLPPAGGEAAGDAATSLGSPQQQQQQPPLPLPQRLEFPPVGLVEWCNEVVSNEPPGGGTGGVSVSVVVVPPAAGSAVVFPLLLVVTPPDEFGGVPTPPCCCSCCCFC